VHGRTARRPAFRAGARAHGMRGMTVHTQAPEHTACKAWQCTPIVLRVKVLASTLAGFGRCWVWRHRRCWCSWRGKMGPPVLGSLLRMSKHCLIDGLHPALHLLLSCLCPPQAHNTGQLCPRGMLQGIATQLDNVLLCCVPFLGPWTRALCSRSGEGDRVHSGLTGRTQILTPQHRAFFTHPNTVPSSRTALGWPRIQHSVQGHPWMGLCRGCDVVWYVCVCVMWCDVCVCVRARAQNSCGQVLCADPYELLCVLGKWVNMSWSQGGSVS